MADDEKRWIAGCGFGAAIVAAPFVALLYDLRAGLAVMMAALAMTLSAVVSAMVHLPPTDQRKLRVLAGFNVVFLVMILVVLLIVIFE